jgi:3',5'-cyclic AMP phosphodiesterase CpdA
MATFHVVHISDLHIAAQPHRAMAPTYVKQCVARKSVSGAQNVLRPSSYLPQTYCPDVARKAAKLIFEQRHGKNLILMSGDIATTGLPHDLAVAHRYVAAPAAAHRGFRSDAGEATFNIPGLPVFLLPGNHDRFQNNLGLAGGRTFDFTFRDYWGRKRRFVRVARMRDRASGDLLVLVAADFCLFSDRDAMAPNFVYRLGQGRVRDEPLEELVGVTEEVLAGDETAALVWVLHFPPAAGASGVKDKYKLLEYQRVLDAADDLGVKLILAGHIHHPTQFREGATIVQCAGSALSFFDIDGNWIHFLEIHAAGRAATLQRRIDYRWNEDQSDFIVV